MLLGQHEVPALIWKEQRVGYRELLARIDAVSRQFPSVPCDRVAIFAENRLDWVYAFYAGLKQGCTLVPIDFMSSAEDVAHILRDCEPSLVFCSNGTREVLAQAIGASSRQPLVLVLDELDPAASDSKAEPIPAPALDKTLLLIYTSGTTGSPKGVMLSWDNLLANIESISKDVPIYVPGQRTLALLPLHHIFPLVGALIAPLYTGGTCVFSPSLASEDMLRALNDNRVTIMIGVPRLYQLITKSIKDKINASRLTRLLFQLAAKINSRAFSKRLFAKVHARFGGQVRFLVSGGAKLDEDVFRDLTTLGFEVLEGFGMTEAAPMITFTRPGESTLGAAGRPMSCNEVRIVDGEILNRGRNVMQGYYKRPEETAAVIKDGWLYTGDLGYIDASGALHVTGRKKEIIVLPSGKNINPVEIEAKLFESTDLISEVAVFQHQDSLEAAVVPDFRRVREQGIADLQKTLNEQVLAPYNKAVTPYKKILKLHLLGEELPKTRLGKLKRFLLPDMVASNQTRTVGGEEPDYPEYKTIQHFLQQQKECAVYAGDHLELDLGLDSLDRVGLQSFLNATFGVGVSDETFIDHPTVGRIAEFIRDKKTKMAVSVVEWAEILKQRSEIHLPRSWAAHNPLRHGMALLARAYFRLSAKGLENLPVGPCILAPNHQSFLDGLFVAAFLDNATMKRTYFFAKAKHVNRPWLRFLAARNNVIVLDLERDLRHALQNLSEVLRQGCNIIIFPEGTRSKDGAVAPFRKTYAILSRELGVPVVPVAIKGAWQALRSGSWLPKMFAPIEVSFLPAVEPGERSYEALNRAVMDRVVAAVGGPT
ncbi:AMP-binding protein [Thiorhodococcus fuscus]|uniref:AMP-binding protein n=1 Tax=Thiorhodococcus fuscus TaxID=527200 RepID=A0ABW4YDR9_9GAMM